MASTQSASRYAKALLDLSLEKGWVELVEKDLLIFSGLMKASDDFRVFIESPVIRDDKKISVYHLVLTDFQDITMQFFKLVTKNGREWMMQNIADEFAAQLKKHRGIVSGSITSAIPLSQDIKNKIIEKIARNFPGKLDLEERIDEKLIGGFIVRIEDKQIDASVASKLRELKQELVK